MPAALYAAYEEASTRHFFPRGTVRCSGEPMFRSELARDLGCLLDLDRHVIAWLCLPIELNAAATTHVPDFMVDYDDGIRIFMDAVEEKGSPDITEAAAIAGLHHRFMCRREIETGFRLQNARDLLRYAYHRTPLNDRIRLLASLDEAGSLTVGECLHVFREVQPMTAIAWMLLNRMIDADLDQAVLGPETVLRRYQR
ncbi:hypothetical protein CO650_28580 [Rhizobium phaseoli]|nr:hypothetical protein CO650_28580 [Rhizobium phaseoli]